MHLSAVRGDGRRCCDTDGLSRRRIMAANGPLLRIERGKFVAVGFLRIFGGGALCGIGSWHLYEREKNNGWLQPLDVSHFFKWFIILI